MKKLITAIFMLIIIPCILSSVLVAEEKGIMERLGRLEAGQEAINKRIDDVRSEIRDVRSDIKVFRSELMQFMLWGYGVTFAGIFALVGFVLWDRRTALAPAIRKNKELEEKEEMIEKALKEMAKKENFVKEALKHAGLL